MVRPSAATVEVILDLFSFEGLFHGKHHLLEHGLSLSDGRRESLIEVTLCIYHLVAEQRVPVPTYGVHKVSHQQAPSRMLRAILFVMQLPQDHTGRIAVVPGDNVDTDRIIPARFLTMVTRSGYGDLLFKDVRGPSFALDLPEAKGASILVVGTNFGCGSSREHAVWRSSRQATSGHRPQDGDEPRASSDIFRGNAGIRLGAHRAERERPRSWSR